MDYGYIVDAVVDEELGLEYAARSCYDVLVVSAELPHREGQNLISQLRRRKVRTPTLILSRTNSVQERVRSLDLGADDCVVKPIAMSELVARIRALSRRRGRASLERITFADLEIDVGRQIASRAGKRLLLTPKEFRILLLLAQRVGGPVPRVEIVERVWSLNSRSETNFVDVHIRRLRRKVDDPFPTKLIHTVKSVGYELRIDEWMESVRSST